MFYGPFLASLYAAYESAVTEIARLIQKKQGQGLSLNDIRGRDFLDRAKKYYKHILHFELSNDNAAWQHIKVLSDLRDVISHTNGRFDMVREKVRKRIRTLERKNIGIEERWGDVVVDLPFLRKTFQIVQVSLEDLVVRYKNWDDATGTA